MLHIKSTDGHACTLYSPCNCWIRWSINYFISGSNYRRIIQSGSRGWDSCLPGGHKAWNRILFILWTSQDIINQRKPAQWRSGTHVVFSNYFPEAVKTSFVWLSRILMCFIIGIPFVCIPHNYLNCTPWAGCYQIMYMIFWSMMFHLHISVCYFLIPNFLLKGKYRLFALYMFLITGIGLALYILWNIIITGLWRFCIMNLRRLFNIIFIIRKIKVYLTLYRSILYSFCRF